MAVVLPLYRFVRSSPFHSPERTARARSSTEQARAQLPFRALRTPDLLLTRRTTTSLPQATRAVGGTFGGRTYRRAPSADSRCWSASKTLTARPTRSEERRVGKECR